MRTIIATQFASLDGFGREMNGLPKYVATRTLTDLAWNNSSVLQGDLVPAVTELKATDGGPLLISGSSSVFNQSAGRRPGRRAAPGRLPGRPARPAARVLAPGPH